jgi:hypothetical protein
VIVKFLVPYDTRLFADDVQPNTDDVADNDVFEYTLPLNVSPYVNETELYCVIDVTDVSVFAEQTPEPTVVLVIVDVKPVNKLPFLYNNKLFVNTALPGD